MKYDYFIVCHSGAGSHSVAKENIYKNVCKKACKAAQTILKSTSTTFPDLIKAAVEAVKVLEDDPCTNAGCGSNLSINGKLQCDAAIMCGQSLRFGAVGSLSNIKNPIVVAEKLLIRQLEDSLLSGGRYPPSVLVGKDATDWAVNNNINSIDDSELITVERFKKYEKYTRILAETENSNGKRKLDKYFEDPPNKQLKIDYPDDNNELDTVGVIIADSLGRVVSATSSGGIFLKQDGRLGQSCMFGCGCFSEQKDNGISVTAVSTGLGEQLMRTMLPMRTCEALSSWTFDDNEDGFHEKFQSFLENNFMKSPFLSGDVFKSFGVVCLRRELLGDNKVSIDFLFGHSTPSLCLAHLSSQDSSPQAVMSRKVDPSTEFVIGSMGTIFTL